jgi:hypothetical protein
MDLAEKRDGRQVVALMSSDHGFDEDIQSTLNLEEVLHKYDNQLQILNEGRFLSLFFSKDWTATQKAALLKDVSLHPKMDLVAYRLKDTLNIQTPNQSISISYSEVFEEKNQKLIYPFLVGNLGHYFNHQEHPDAILIPQPGVALQSLYLGQHGGPTEQEVLVPLLLHNAKLSESTSVPALWELLNFL